MKKYKYLQLSDRRKIADLYRNGSRIKDIADDLEVSQKRGGNALVHHGAEPARAVAVLHRRSQHLYDVVIAAVEELTRSGVERLAAICAKAT